MIEVFKIILLVASFINGFLAIASFRYYKSPGAISFGVFLTATFLYSFGYSFELTSPTLIQMHFWLMIECYGVVFVPAFMIIYALQYIGRDDLLSLPVKILLIGFSFLGFLASVTNDQFHLMYTNFWIDTNTPIPILRTSKGIWYWVHQGYSVCSMLVFVYFFSRTAIKGDRRQRFPAILMALGAIPPWTSYLIYILGYSPYGIDIIPFTFIIMSVITASAVFKYKLFDFAPLALENVFASMSDIVIIVDSKRRITNFNKSAQRIFSFLNPLSIGKLFRDEFHDNPIIINELSSSSNNEGELIFQVRGEEKTYQTTLSIIENKQGQLIGKILILRDISERKLNEKLLKENEAYLKSINSTKDKLFSIIGHDLRGPVSNLNHLSLMLDESYDSFSDEDRRRIVKLLYQSSIHTLKLTENILIWAKSQTEGFTFSPSNLPLKKIVAEICELHEQAALHKKIRVIQNVPDEIELWGDENMINLIIRNLLSNAIKFTPHGGVIDISSSENENESIVSVKDSGIGMPPQIAENLFSINRNIRRNGTDNETGTGLGLILSKDFIDKHHGQIWAISSPDIGTTFSFSIPKKSKL